MSTKLQDLAAAWAANRGNSLSTNTVYSTQEGTVRESPKEAINKPLNKAVNEGAKNGAKNAVKVSRETKGRGGKAVTLAIGVPLVGESLAELGKRLKTACGSGGTVKDGVIEVQGDHIDRIIKLLIDEGFQAKRVGG